MMDYEKAYKASLHTATQWIKDGCTDKEKICLESVFPELRESEDERIRKALIDGVSQIRCKGDITREQMLAYLEKQKEQKPAWSEEDENKLEQCIRIVTGWEADYDVVKSPYSNFLKSLRPSWKPSRAQMSMLLAVINEPNNASSESCHLALAELYGELKKLM